MDTKLAILLLACVAYAHAQTLNLDIPEFMADATKDDAVEEPSGTGRYDWQKAGEDELKIALHVQNNINLNKAKNVVLFIGDSMGPTTVTAARFYKAQKDKTTGKRAMLAWDRFPHVGMSQTHSFNRLTIDSAASATAIMGGGKTTSATFGLTHKCKYRDCKTSLTERQTTTLDYSLAEGKSVGIVTSARLTHATPGSAYAHTADRSWESDIPSEFLNDDRCKDVARQLIEDNPNINVLLGGGREYFMPNTQADPEYPDKMGRRVDGRNLVQAWLDKKDEDIGDDSKYKYVWDKAGFDAVDPEEVDYLLGMFEPGHIQYQLDRDTNKEPSPEAMVEKALKILQKNDKGFFLLVEGARIDHAGHANLPTKALDEAYWMSKQVEKVLSMTNEKETLVVVTGDHSIALTINGYSSVNRNILLPSDHILSPAGASPLMDDGLPYMVLQYSNGPGYETREGTGAGCRRRVDYRNKPDSVFTDKDFLSDVLSPTSYAQHGGEDVTIFANGPLAHLFHGVHQESYIAHVMNYASCVGPNKDHCTDRVKPPCMGASSVRLSFTLALVALIASVVLKLTF